jgi:hypothetical protein
MEVIERGAGPVGRVDVEELRGAGDRQLVGHAAAEEIVEIIREEEAARGLVLDGGAAGEDFGELEAGVVEDVRDAGGGVDAFEGRGCRRVF